MKTIAQFILLIFVTEVSAADKLIFEVPTAQQLNGDIHFLRSKAEEQQKLLDLKAKELELAAQESLVFKQKSEGLLLDVQALTKAKDDYKDLYQKENKARLGCEDSKPSRATWFGAGVISTLVLGVVLALVAK